MHIHPALINVLRRACRDGYDEMNEAALSGLRPLMDARLVQVSRAPNRKLHVKATREGRAFFEASASS